jgi:hypothetical protein
MNTKLVAAFILTSLLAGMLAVLPIRQAAAAGTATLSINPHTTTRGPGDVDSFFDVYLDVNLADQGLFGFDINVTWADNTLIALDYLTSNSSTATLLSALWPSGWLMMISESGGGGGGGYFRLVALSISSASTTGVHSLIAMHFKILRGCNFELQTAITIDRNLAKLSDINYTPITVTAYDDGLFKITARTPGLVFELYEPDTHPYEYGKIFKVRVYVNQTCATLKDYDLVIEYKAELLTLTGVDWTGSVLKDGDEYFTESTKGIINIVDPGVVGPTTYSNLANGLLFTLTFRIEFSNTDAGHIWRQNNLGPLQAFIKFTAASLSFLEGGPILMGGINMPADLDITVNLIRGDADCDGNVDVFDLRCIAFYYDKKSTDSEWATCSKYNLVSSDNTIDIFDLVAASTNFGYGGPI